MSIGAEQYRTDYPPEDEINEIEYSRGHNKGRKTPLRDCQRRDQPPSEGLTYGGRIPCTPARAFADNYLEPHWVAPR
jgi:hypothetical protein